MSSPKPFAIRSYQHQQRSGYFTPDSMTNHSSLPTTPRIIHEMVNSSSDGYNSDSSEEGRAPQVLGLRVFNPDKDTTVAMIPEKQEDVSAVPSKTEWKVYQLPNTTKPELPMHQPEPETINIHRESKTLAYATVTNEITTPNEVIKGHPVGSVYGSPTSPTFNQVPPANFANPIQSKYTKVSYHLTNDPTALKTYRDMAEKTNDPTTQLMFAKYLFETANAYASSKSEKRIGSMWGIGSTTNKIQIPEPVLVVPHPSCDVASSSYSSIGSKTKSVSENAALNKQKQHTTSVNTKNQQKRKVLEAEGVKWIVRLAKQNVPEACYMQANWMENSLYGFKPNKSKSLALHEIAAQANLYESVYAVAKHYEKEGELDSRKIIKMYQSASDAGYVNAIYKLAFLKIYGRLSVRQSLTEGLDLMYKACTLSSKEFNTPPYTFALMLTNEYEQVDFPLSLLEPYGGKEAAILYYERAAQLENHHAQAKLGSIYEHGLFGESMNFARAFDYYEQAVVHENDHAMLGLCRLNNRGSHGPGDTNETVRLENDVSGWLAASPVNEDVAFSWCERAAKSGNTDALALLGWFYESGFGVPRDFARAEKYYQMAADKGDKGAKTRLMNTNVSITKTQHEGLDVKRKTKSQSRCRCM